MVFVHLGLWHKDGSNNSLGIKAKAANIIVSEYLCHGNTRRVLCTTNYYKKVLKISFKVKIRTSQGGESDGPLSTAGTFSVPASYQ